jgi:hypothetical protein
LARNVNIWSRVLLEDEVEGVAPPSGTVLMSGAGEVGSPDALAGT